ncbi:MAG TPA: transposase [Pyrinomonadaceae bacterium]|nr:transposase [Pyrinomonadaceae bacterium]
MTNESEDSYTRRNSLRLRTFDYTAKRIYFVTIVAAERRRIFKDKHVAQVILDCLHKLRQKMRFNLYVYCLMPDHFHALIGIGESDRTLGAICGAFKSLSTRAFWQWYEGKLWQRQFFDHIIRNETDLLETRDYIRLNPVRKGLVEKWEDWPYTGSVDKLYL